MTTHPLECTCHACTRPLTKLLARIAREQIEIEARRARSAARLASDEDTRRRLTIAAYEAGLLYEWARGHLRLRKAAQYAARFHGVKAYRVLEAVQRTHGQGLKRGKPAREQRVLKIARAA